ncbi:MAG: DUF4174 domain-containing protein [Balneolaceae bacterium]|nr:DUF4174 domain-containing protein [Balneolaceae bacterium]
MLAKIVFNIFVMLLLLPFLMMAQGDPRFELSEYRWENRLLLVFAPTQEHPLYKQQLDELNKEKAGMLERDLKVFHLFSEDASFGDGYQINSETVKNLYRRYNADPNNYTIVLLGKDGTEKTRKSSLLTTEKLFTLIDSMPMRQREVRNQGDF